jgi:hypothetical protein
LTRFLGRFAPRLADRLLQKVLGLCLQYRAWKDILVVPLPVPDPGVCDAEMDIEVPIYLHLHASAGVERFRPGPCREAKVVARRWSCSSSSGPPLHHKRTA